MNRLRPNHATAYAFGSSFVSDQRGLQVYLSSVIASLASLDSDRSSNVLVIVGVSPWFLIDLL